MSANIQTLAHIKSSLVILAAMVVFGLNVSYVATDRQIAVIDNLWCLNVYFMAVLAYLWTLEV